MTTFNEFDLEMHPWACRVCGRSFSSSYGYEQHLLSHVKHEAAQPEEASP